MDALAKYGKNQERIWSDGRKIVLGCRIDDIWTKSRAETQPFSHAGYWVVGDVRIDNRDELIADLDIGAEARTVISDIELVLRAFLRWRQDCPLHIIGDYVFVIWDSHLERLFCARDHIGARPLFYFDCGAIFAFATDLRALLDFRDVPAEIDETEIIRMLQARVPRYFDNERTFFRNIRKIPFGHSLLKNRSRLHTSRYWRPEEIRAIELPTVEDYAVRLRELMEIAVRDRLRTDVPVGAHLSGGLDSSAISVLVARILRERGHSAPSVFSWSPPPTESVAYGEYSRIGAVCTHEKLEPIYTDAPNVATDEAVEEDPAARPAFALTLERFVQRRAKMLGVRIMFSGWGGDDAVSSGARGLLAEDLRRLRLGKASSRIWSRIYFRHPRSILQILRLFWHDGLSPLLPDVLYRSLSSLRAQRDYIAPDFLVQMSGARPPVFRIPRTRAGARTNQWQAYYHGGITARIESWTVFGADNDISYVYPMLDRRVLEFIYAIPVDLHDRQGYGRYLCRRAMAGILPPHVVWSNPKAEPSFSIQVEGGVATRRERYIRSIELAGSDEIPWVDIPRLRSALQSGNCQTGDWISINHAIRAIIVWRRWGKRVCSTL